MKTTLFQGMEIRIENVAGSVRKGVNKAIGKKWSTIMPYDYGELIGSMGVDSDPIDCFIGNNKQAKFVFIVHQTNSHSGTFDEDKVFLGFDNAMDAKDAYYKAYDQPDLFFGSISTCTIEDFKKKLLQSKTSPALMHASKMNTAIALSTPRNAGKGIGEPVTVNGQHGRGVITQIEGRRVTIKFRNGIYITRDISEVQKMSDNTVSQMWRH